MGMFTNYQNISNNYIPNNLVCSFPTGKSYTKLDPVDASKPYEEYDVEGNLIGYSWQYGETLKLEFNIEGEVVVESDAIVYYAHNEAPSFTTVGKVGQRAYNVTDLRSWTCSAVTERRRYEWIEDSEFEHDTDNASKSIYVSAANYLADKKLELQILNFRFEPVYTATLDGTSRLIFTIDRELSEQLVKGLYYCSLTVVTDFLRTPLFGAQDCKLLVK